jgi:hypothetical protein
MSAIGFVVLQPPRQIRQMKRRDEMFFIKQ